MPSLEIVQVFDDDDVSAANSPDAPAPTIDAAQPAAARPKVTPTMEESSKSGAASKPAAAKKKNAAAASKKQLSLTSFFGATAKPKKQPSSPARLAKAAVAKNESHAAAAAETSKLNIDKIAATPTDQTHQLQAASLDDAKKNILRDICIGVTTTSASSKMASAPNTASSVEVIASSSAPREVSTNASGADDNVDEIATTTGGLESAAGAAATDDSKSVTTRIAKTASPKRLESAFCAANGVLELVTKQEEEDEVTVTCSDHGSDLNIDDEEGVKRDESIEIDVSVDDESVVVVEAEEREDDDAVNVGEKLGSEAATESNEEYADSRNLDDKAMNAAESSMEAKRTDDDAAMNDDVLEIDANETAEEVIMLDNVDNKVTDASKSLMDNASTVDEQQFTPDAVANTRKRAASIDSGAAIKKRAAPSDQSIPEELQKAMEKHQHMRDRYRDKARKILAKCKDMPEEQFKIALPESASVPDVESIDFSTFPDFAVATLAALIEGSIRSLTDLSFFATDSLNSIYDTTEFVHEVVSDKLKILATRKQYIKHPFIATNNGSLVDGSDAKDAIIDIFQDEHVDYMWRWEVSCIDLLPADATSPVKAARAARKKIASQFAALDKLLCSLNEADRLILLSVDGSGKTSKSGKSAANQLEKMFARISQEEEKVLKFERQEEAFRLSVDAKRKAKAVKTDSSLKPMSDEAKKQKDIEKENKAKEREAEKLKRTQEREAERLKRAQEKEHAKQMKIDEAERKKQEKADMEAKEKAKKDAEIRKQAACMMSVFQPKMTQKAPVAAASVALKEQPALTEKLPKQMQSGVLECEILWRAIGSCGTISRRPFQTLSKRARVSRKRRTSRISTTVTVTVLVGEEAENPFNESEGPYAEDRQLTVEVLNKNKFLSFHEDLRPPYWGTWSKHSSSVTGNKPFGRDVVLDYEHDSEAEWEEGDDEVGEDVELETAEDEEEKELDAYETNDGWFANDDEVIYVEVDPEVDVEMPEKPLNWQTRLVGSEDRTELTVGNIAPIEGRPFTSDAFHASLEHEDMVTGISVEEAQELLNLHSVEILDDAPIYLDSFPPELIEETDQEQELLSSKAMQDEDQRTFARFVHMSTQPKAQLVDDFRLKHEALNVPRSQLLRFMDAAAEKQKFPISGQSLWVVKEEVLDALELDDLIEVGTASAEEAQKEAIRIIAKFVHHSTTSSKEKLVDELRQANPILALSRQKALKVLDETAEKMKHPDGGYYWVVKSAVKVELDLLDLADTVPVKKNDEEALPAEKCGADSFTLALSKPLETDGAATHERILPLKRKGSDDGDALPSADSVHDAQPAPHLSPAKKHATTLSSVKLLQSHLIKKKQAS
ncbi:hypothetical protein MPSEU_000322700 [Mayamaea pseudoterrestris]|nr:hypothetical protein MPSEU_000322700 [Mayamaea pseudoterrestris]